jgi:hypothetical protein
MDCVAMQNVLIRSNTTSGRNCATMMRRLLALGLAILPLLFLSAGARAQKPPVPFVQNPLIPDTAMPGRGNLTLTLLGTGFTSHSVVNWNGSARATTFVSSTKLTATILSSDFAKAGTAAVTVTNASVAQSNITWFPVNTPNTTVGTSRTDVETTGGNPTGVAIADFNGDGILDMAISNDMSNTVAIYFGNGDGTFQTPTPSDIYAVAGNPYNILVGDVNNDGKLDLVTGNLSSQSISVLLGNGDGTFQPAMNTSTGVAAESITMADVNFDGNLDLVIPNYLHQEVAVLLGNGNGTFQQPVNYAVQGLPIDVKLGDFTGDGKLDIAAVNNYSNTVSILFGNGDGTFQNAQNYPTGMDPNAIGVADINGDGFPDLVTTNGGSTITVLLNAGNGTFLNTETYKSGLFPSYVVGIADMGNTGKLDVIVPNFSCFMLDIYYGNGNGSLQKIPTFLPVAGQVDALGIADFNNDGRLDIVALDEFANTLSILIQSPVAPPQFSPAYFVFSSVTVGHSASQTFIFTNSTGSSLTNVVLSLGGPSVADFSQVNTCPATLNAGADCTITVTFTPPASKTYAATVQVTDSVGTQAAFVQGSGS